jgi:hypothetical protein
MKNMKPLIVLLLAAASLLLHTPADAQNASLIPFRKGRAWGYCTPDKRLVIAPVYLTAGLFHEGVAIATLPDGKSVLLDQKGAVLSKSYDRIDPFSDGMAKVASNGWAGFIDRTGKEIIALQYDDVPESFFRNGLARVAKTFHDGKKWGCINKKGEEIVPVSYYWLDDFHSGMALYEDPQKGYGFIDLTGKKVIPADPNNQITQALHFGNSDRTLIKRNGVVVLIDKTGNVIKTYKYDEIGWRYEKVIMVGQHGKWGFIDYNGNIVAPLMYDEDQWGDLPFQKGLGLGVVSVNGQWGVINQQNQPILPFQHEGIEVFPNGLFSVWRTARGGEYEYGVLSPDGEVLPIRYRQLLICDNGLIFASQSYQWTLFDKTGKPISDAEYYSVDRFSEGLAAVTRSLNGKYGYIDPTGKQVIPSKYDLAAPFSNGLALVVYKKQEGYISASGVEYWED